MRCGAKQILRAGWSAGLCAAAGLLALAGPVAAVEAVLAAAASRPRIGLALSGGGARGAAHVGVLKVLEELHIPIDCIAGTSMGSIVGGLYASGIPPDELEKMITQIDWTSAFSDFIPRTDRSFRRKRDDDLYLVRHKPGISSEGLLFPPGLLDGQKIDLLLKRYTLHVAGIRDFDALSIPFRCVAADLATGEPVVLDHGDLALAMRASMSIPIVFTPREIDGHLLVDGGIARNLPVEVVRQMGADIVIAVDISTPLRDRADLRSVIAVTDQITGIMTRRDTDEQIAALHPGDVLVRPDLGGITTASFDRAAEAIPIGSNAAIAAASSLSRLAVSAPEYQAYAARRAEDAQAARRAPPIVDEIRILNHSRIDTGVIEERIHVVVGMPLAADQLEKDIDQLVGLELFESVYYELSGGPEHVILTVTVRERAWGPNYLQAGVAVFEEYEGANFNLAAAYTRTAINRLNGEWRLGVQFGGEPGAFTELYQPITESLRPFIHLKAAVSDREDNVFDANGNKIGELEPFVYKGEAAVGRELGSAAEIRAGILREAGTVSTKVGPTGTPDDDVDTGEAFLQVWADKLDNPYFPHSGGDLRVRLSAGLEALGSEVHYEQARIDGGIAGSHGRMTGHLEGTVATTSEGDAPYLQRYRLGGFTRLSGLEQDELAGQHAAIVAALAYYRFAELGVLSAYFGLSLEYGNVFQTREEWALENGRAAGSAFLGLDTPIGPVYIAYGVADGNRRNYYFCLGKRR